MVRRDTKEGSAEDEAAGLPRAESVASELARCYEAGRAAWPLLALDREAFERYFARHTSQTPPERPYAADMYLACACANGNDAALAALERLLAGDVALAVASIDSSRAFVQDTLQATRERLLVRVGGQPGKIGDYGGRASLKSWLCAVAVRLAISRLRRKGEQRQKPFDAESDRRLARGGPEFEYLRGRYKGAFEDAIRSAVEQLSPKERMLLRLNVAEGMSVDRLAAIYQVGRSTAARWLASARRTLLEKARRELHVRFPLTSTELDSLGADMRSQLDVSIAKLLALTGGQRE
jgi:RNA polymerase sigma-70 factor (ECF subfamily)